MDDQSSDPKAPNTIAPPLAVSEQAASRLKTAWDAASHGPQQGQQRGITSVAPSGLKRV